VSRFLRSAALAAAYAAMLVALGPSAPDGDAVGHLKKAADPSAIEAGHLLYVPCLRAAVHAAGAIDPVDGWLPGRCLSAIAVAAAALVVAGAARRVAPRTGGTAGLLFAGCAAVFGAGSTVESYGITLLAIAIVASASLRALDGSAVAAGIGGAAAGVAAGLHVGVAPLLVLPVAAALIGERRSLARAALAATAGAAVFLAPLVAVAVARSLDAAGTFALVRSADHGLPGFEGPWLVLSLPFGVARAIVDCPFPWEHPLSFALRIGPALVVLAAGAGVLARGARRAPEPARLLLVAGALPLAAIAVAYYASEPERWVVCLPLAVPIAAAGANARSLVVFGVALLALHVATVAIPGAVDPRPRERARAMSERLETRELVVSPGHGVDEIVGFFERVEPERLLLAYEAGRLRSAGDAVLDEMATRVRAAIADGRPVRVVRVFEDDGDARGWKDLKRIFGIEREQVIERLEVIGVRRPPAGAAFARVEPRALTGSSGSKAGSSR